MKATREAITETHLLSVVKLEIGHQTRDGQSTLIPFSRMGLVPPGTPPPNKVPKCQGWLVWHRGNWQPLPLTLRAPLSLDLRPVLLQ